ncbi:tRNA lysidine(34) synthetase TilS [Sodalis-like secondary symbiont of Drepanosiphum platanoidis]|uniref:tRNA lysidine(34) synthetase TilS n=1 Tax=Sodalis-like secondary symbiont of Drepanosiphum platanoidis TaxID=2994493 RepID=UPI003463AB1E
MKIDLNIFNEIISSIKNYKNLLVAFSGGIDSMVLIDILSLLRDKKIKNNLSFKFRAIHINHFLNKNSKKWAIYCKNECKKRNILYNIYEINLSKIKNNIEEKARNYRYKIFKKNIKSHEILLTAHHQDDQAETLLLSLKRGSGPLGLSSMNLNSKFYKNRIIRPLLNCSKIQIKNYAKYRKLNWIYDKSNDNEKFDRNFLRINIIPLFTKRWPKFNYLVSRTARLCYEQEKLLNDLLKKELNKLIKYDGSLYFKPLINMKKNKIFFLLRRWIHKNKIKMPSEKQINIILNEIILSKKKSMPIFHLSNKIISKYKNKLYILEKQECIKLDNTIILWKKKNNKLSLPENLGIIYKFFEKNIYYSEYFFLKKNKNKEFFMIFPIKIFIRLPNLNENIFIKFRNKKKSFHTIIKNKKYSLKKIFNKMSVPPWWRNRIPLLFYNNNLISALGLFVSDFAYPIINNKILKIIWKNNIKN